MLDYYVEQGAGIDLIVAPLLRLPPGTVRRCLEIGGSVGFALDFGRYAFGWEVLGVDPSPLAAAGAEALGLPVRRSYFSADLDLGPEPFDLAICSEVLEHIAEPHALLAAIRDRLSPDGILVLSTPNLALVRPEAEAGRARPRPQPGVPHGALRPPRSRPGPRERRFRRRPRRGVAGDAPRLRGALPGGARTGCGRPTRPRSGPSCAATSRPGRRALPRLPPSPAASPTGTSRSASTPASTRRRRRAAPGWRGSIANASGSIWRQPDLEAGRTLPFNLTGALFFSGILELNGLGRPDRAAACFAAAVAAGTLLQGRQNPFGLRDGETEALVAQSRKHLPMALAATEPDRAVREIEALERAMPGRGLSPALLAEARAQTFIRLVNAGAYDGGRAPGSALGTGNCCRARGWRRDRAPRLSILSIASACWRSTGSVRTRPRSCSDGSTGSPEERTEIFESARLHEELGRQRAVSRRGTGLMLFRRFPRPAGRCWSPNASSPRSRGSPKWSCRST